MTAVTQRDWLLDDRLQPDAGHPALRPLFDAAARGALALPFCAACAIPLELEQLVCDGCGSADRVWREVPLAGVVHSATVMHRREAGLVVTEGPYPLIDVETESGHRMIMTTAVATNRAPAIGDTVAIAFRRVGDVAVPAVDNTAKYPSQ
jgi:uncharacterized OB-fold protein